MNPDGFRRKTIPRFPQPNELWGVDEEVTVPVVLSGTPVEARSESEALWSGPQALSRRGHFSVEGQPAWRCPRLVPPRKPEEASWSSMFSCVTPSRPGMRVCKLSTPERGCSGCGVGSELSQRGTVGGRRVRH